MTTCLSCFDYPRPNITIVQRHRHIVASTIEDDQHALLLSLKVACLASNQVKQKVTHIQQECVLDLVQELLLQEPVSS